MCILSSGPPYIANSSASSHISSGCLIGVIPIDLIVSQWRTIYVTIGNYCIIIVIIDAKTRN